jgi:uncharacterized membrane protein
MITALLATLATGLFAGAAVYITLVEHPARMSCGVAVAVAEFRPSYQRATVTQASLAVIGSLAALGHWWQGGSVAWLIGGLLLAAVIPFTLVVIRPTNERLLDESLDTRSTDAAALLARWARLHAVRSVSSLLAFVIFLSRLGLA